MWVKLQFSILDCRISPASLQFSCFTSIHELHNVNNCCNTLNYSLYWQAIMTSLCPWDLVQVKCVKKRGVCISSSPLQTFITSRLLKPQQVRKFLKKYDWSTWEYAVSPHNNLLKRHKVFFFFKSNIQNDHFFFFFSNAVGISFNW